MPKKDQISPEDKALFRESAGVTRRIKSDRVEHSKTKRSTSPRKLTTPTAPEDPFTEEVSSTVDSLYDSGESYWEDPATQISPEQELSYALTGVDQKTMSQLKAGKFPIAAKLDLHGMKAEEAKIAIVEFILTHRCHYRQCVCIIHGKSQRNGAAPILKSKVNSWLRQLKDVVAFHSAPPRLGGAGAMLVLIKHRNKAESENYAK